MYTMILNMIGYTDDLSTGAQQYIIYICGALILVFTVVFIDMVYRIFSHFWRGRK